MHLFLVKYPRNKTWGWPNDVNSPTRITPIRRTDLSIYRSVRGWAMKRFGFAYAIREFCLNILRLGVRTLVTLKICFRTCDDDIDHHSGFDIEPEERENVFCQYIVDFLNSNQPSRLSLEDDFLNLDFPHPLPLHNFTWPPANPQLVFGFNRHAAEQNSFSWKFFGSTFADSYMPTRCLSILLTYLYWKVRNKALTLVFTAFSFITIMYNLVSLSGLKRLQIIIESPNNDENRNLHILQIYALLLSEYLFRTLYMQTIYICTTSVFFRSAKWSY